MSTTTTNRMIHSQDWDFTLPRLGQHGWPLYFLPHKFSFASGGPLHCRVCSSAQLVTTCNTLNHNFWEILASVIVSITLDSQSIPLMTSLAALYHYQQRNLLKQGATKKQKTNRTRISVEVLEILGCGTIMLVASLRRLPTPCPFTPTLKTGSLRQETEEKKCKCVV